MALGCCGSSQVGNEKAPPEEFFFKKRGCTDVACLIFFGVFWGGLFWLLSLSLTYGEPWAIVYGADYLGNRCGRDSMSEKKKVYYPRIDKDIADQAVVAASTPWKLRFYGLCMEECPNITQPTDCFDNPDSCKVIDYGTAAEREAAGGSSYYYATMPSQDVLNRCIPKDSASLVQDPDRCAFPQCDNVTYPWMVCDETYPTTWKMTYPESKNCEVKFEVGLVQQLRTMASDTLAKSLGQYVQGMAEVAEAIAAAQLEIILYGMVMPIVLGFGWLLLLKMFARTIVYVGLITIGILLGMFTLYCFIMSGALASAMANTTLADANSSALAPAGDAYAAAMGMTESDPMVQTTEGETVDEGNDPVFWNVIGAISLIVFFLYVITMCLARKKISKAVALVKEATNVIKDRPQTMFFPFNFIVVQLGVLIFFLIMLLLLGTASLDQSHLEGDPDAVKAGGSYVDAMKYYNKSGADGVEDDANSSVRVQVSIYLYVFFGLLWSIEVCGNVSFTAMSGNVSHWYFFRDDPKGQTKVPLLRSLGRVLFYHLGSIVFGSFIIAAIKLIRYILMAIDKYTADAQKKNFLLRLSLKCCMCCMWCLEKTIKFITGYAYIYVALQGSSFCASCMSTFALIMANPAQLAINNLIRTVLGWLQILAVPIICAWFCNAHLVGQGVEEPLWATTIVAFMAIVISMTFATVFACTLDTLFVCACRDKADYNGEYMPNGLRSAFGFDKKHGKYAGSKKNVAADSPSKEGGGETKEGEGDEGAPEASDALVAK